MKIIKMNGQEDWEQKYKREGFKESSVPSIKESLVPSHIDRIIEQILMICKFDKNFINENIDDIDRDIEEIKNKIKNKNGILNKSNDIRKLLKNKISELENKNFEIKTNLLDYLGAEL